MRTDDDKSRRVVHIGGVPSPKQKSFFESRTRYTAYGGARGGGKSWALRRKLVGMCLCYPGIRCLLVRRTLVEIRANHVLPMLSEYGALLRFSQGESAFLFDNGSRIDCGYCDSERDTLRYQGQEYDVIAIDEATQLSELQFNALRATLRGVRPMPRRMYLTCNPGGVGHAWVKRLFVDREFRVGENPEDYSFISAKVWDNTALTASDPDYVRSLQALPDRLRQAWLHGRWDVFEGQFFAELDEGRHVVPSAVPAPEDTLFAAMDYGFDRLAFLVLCEDAQGNVSVLDELCASGLTLGEAAAQVAERLKDFGGRVEYIVASPDLWNRRQDSGRSGVSVMQYAAPLPPLRAADDRRVAGWRVVREYLHDGEGRPKLRICATCRELIRCMQGLLCDPNRPEDASSHPHALTHAPEALRYALMSRYERVEQKESAPVQRDFRFQRPPSLWD